MAKVKVEPFVYGYGTTEIKAEQPGVDVYISVSGKQIALFPENALALARWLEDAAARGGWEYRGEEQVVFMSDIPDDRKEQKKRMLQRAMACPTCRRKTLPYGGFGSAHIWSTTGKYRCVNRPTCRAAGTWYGNPQTGELFERDSDRLVSLRTY